MKPRVIIEYDSATQNCSWTIESGIPIKDLVMTLKLLETTLIMQQLENVAQQSPKNEPRVLVPDVHLPRH